MSVEMVLILLLLGRSCNQRRYLLHSGGLAVKGQGVLFRLKAGTVGDEKQALVVQCSNNLRLVLVGA